MFHVPNEAIFDPQNLLWPPETLVRWSLNFRMIEKCLVGQLLKSRAAQRKCSSSMELLKALSTEMEGATSNRVEKTVFTKIETGQFMSIANKIVYVCGSIEQQVRQIDRQHRRITFWAPRSVVVMVRNSAATHKHVLEQVSEMKCKAQNMSSKLFLLYGKYDEV